MDHQAMNQMNSTHHFNNDSKMSIQVGVVKRGNALGPILSERKNQLSTHHIDNPRPFDNTAHKLTFGERMQLNRTVQHEISDVNLRRQFQSVEVGVVKLGDARERSRLKKFEKKVANLKRENERVTMMEKAREGVLEEYKIKPVQ
jgi:hypothetical protein